jgi:DNA-binding LytR/AlgR family response regulator
MPEKTGFEMLEELIETPAIIFTTAYNEFAIKAFEVNALDYILKPIETSRLREAISKAKKQLGWEPVITFEELVHIMMDHDLTANGIIAPGLGNQAVIQKGFDWTSHAFAKSIEQSARDIG